MSKKLSIALDFDDCIYPTSELKEAYFQEKLGIGPEENFLMIHFKNANPNQYKDLNEQFYAAREYFLEHPDLRPGFIDVFTKLSNRHSVKLVTARIDEQLETAQMLLSKNGCILDATGVGYGNDKNDALQGCTVFVDDDIDHLRSAPVKHKFLFTTEENKNIDLEGTGITRVNDWFDFELEVEIISHTSTLEG